MVGKLIEMIRLLPDCVCSGSHSHMDKCFSLASEVDEYERILTGKLVKSSVRGRALDGIIRFPFRLERCGDMLERILHCCGMKTRQRVPFNDEAYAELDELFSTLSDMMINLRNAFRCPDPTLLRKVMGQEEELRGMIEDFTFAHWERLKAGICPVQASSMYRDILDSSRMASEYAAKMAATLLDLVESQQTESENLGLP